MLTCAYQLCRMQSTRMARCLCCGRVTYCDFECREQDAERHTGECAHMRAEDTAALDAFNGLTLRMRDGAMALTDMRSGVRSAAVFRNRHILRMRAHGSMGMYERIGHPRGPREITWTTGDVIAAIELHELMRCTRRSAGKSVRLAGLTASRGCIQIKWSG